MKMNQVGVTSLSIFGLLAGLSMTTQAQLVDGQTIGVDFGPVAPTNNFNQRDNSGTNTDVIDVTGAAVANVTVDLIGATFSNDDADDNVGNPPAVYDSSNLTDWVGAVNSDDGMTITIAGLDDTLTYNLNIGHAFDNNAQTNGTMYSAGAQTVTNVDASVDPNFFNLNGLSTDGAGNLVITISLPVVEGGPSEVPAVSGLTLTAVFDSDGDGLSDGFEIANMAVGYDPSVDDSGTDFDNDDLTVAEELAAGTDVLVADTDEDDINDGAEVTGSPATNPLVPDTDGDGLTDGEEVNGSPSSNPTLPDTDGDGISDGLEIDAGTDPNDDQDFPVFRLAIGQTIGVDFGPTDPTNNFNQRNNNGTTTGIIDITGAPVSNVTVDLIGATFSNNDSDDNIGVAPEVYDSSNLTDWVGSVDPFEGLTITIAGLDDGLAYDLNIGHAFDGNARTNGTTYSAGTQSATNVDAAADPNFFDLDGLTTDGAGNLVIRVGLPLVGGDTDVVTVSGLTLTAVALSSDLALSIENSADTNELVFTWASQVGRVYDLRSNTDLSTAPSTWDVLEGEISADVSGINTLTIPRASEPKVFFALEERVAP